ncbi:hypothetical protein [Paraburkholderia sp. Ac-20347]|uniref:hypothetical protein n=1 Tax=Paraburkholderia sp. Ac-20347 TaxID=2703892 RepID=UPI0019814467|nr:hypothetical protein [Paraburkholderia sp. Ac-20347]MBN3811665.1 hypothetical protein [Paraburkholderia sp. Ac-20347]
MDTKKLTDTGAYDVRSTLQTITLLCEVSGEPCDGPRFRELILKARSFLAAPPSDAAGALAAARSVLYCIAKTYDDAELRERALEAYEATLAAPVAPAAPINLEGLRKKLLTPREIVRDDQGFLTHPDFPICDEGTRADKFLEAFGIETWFRSMESDLPDLYERWCDGEVDNCTVWTPTAPEGDGWLLLEIYDTEDGPYALFGRDKYEAENALKRQRMRDGIQRRRENQGDAQ